MTLFKELEKIAHGGGKDSYIATYMMRHYKQIPEKQLKEIQLDTYCSNSTLSRFFKRMGFIGFVDFKISIAKEGRQIDKKEENYGDPDLRKLTDVMTCTGLLLKDKIPLHVIETWCEVMLKTKMAGLLVTDERLVCCTEHFRRKMREYGINVVLMKEEDLSDTPDCMMIIADRDFVEDHTEVMSAMKEKGIALVVLSDCSCEMNETYHVISLPDCSCENSLVEGYMKESMISCVIDLIALYISMRVSKDHGINVADELANRRVNDERFIPSGCENKTEMICVG